MMQTDVRGNGAVTPGSPTITDRAVISRLAGAIKGRDLTPTAEGILASAKALRRSAILDLSEVSYVASGAIGVIVDLSLRLSEAGLRLVLACPDGGVKGLLQAMGVTVLLDCCGSLDEALDRV